MEDSRSARSLEVALVQTTGAAPQPPAASLERQRSRLASLQALSPMFRYASFQSAAASFQSAASRLDSFISPGTFCCSVCLDQEVETRFRVVVEACGRMEHAVCRACMEANAAMSTENNHLHLLCCPSCMEEQTPSPMSESEVRAVTTDEVFQTYLRFRSLQDPLARECPNSRCKGIARAAQDEAGNVSKEMKCQACNVEFCYAHASSHEPGREKCEEFQRIAGQARADGVTDHHGRGTPEQLEEGGMAGQRRGWPWAAQSAPSQESARDRRVRRIGRVLGTLVSIPLLLLILPGCLVAGVLHRGYRACGFLGMAADDVSACLELQLVFGLCGVALVLHWKGLLTVLLALLLLALLLSLLWICICPWILIVLQNVGPGAHLDGCDLCIYTLAPPLVGLTWVVELLHTATRVLLGAPAAAEDAV